MRLKGLNDTFHRATWSSSQPGIPTMSGLTTILAFLAYCQSNNYLEDFHHHHVGRDTRARQHYAVFRVGPDINENQLPLLEDRDLGAMKSAISVLKANDWTIEGGGRFEAQYQKALLRLEAQIDIAVRDLQYKAPLVPALPSMFQRTGAA